MEESTKKRQEELKKRQENNFMWFVLGFVLGAFVIYLFTIL